ncbi:MAG: pyrroline-5-carboxylate reductase [Deltaproteobacteria bacterium]|nr:pyrroline-5-carboxylate reductase [Deltaproteobacteria bacterium]
MLTDRTVAILGTGTMGRALGTGLVNAGVIAADRVRGTVRHEAERDRIAGDVDFSVGTDNVAATRGAAVVLLCTKPKTGAGLLKELADAGALDHEPLIISICAGVSTGALEEACAHKARIVRAMPNTPCQIGEGMTVVAGGNRATDEDIETALQIFHTLGRALVLDEEHMNTVTGLSGSGPAFVYVIIEALSEGGVMMGLPRSVATELAAQTVKGAARMVLETGRHPAALKDDVTTPAGCTISALMALEDGRLRSVLARGVQEAARSAAGLGGE